MLDEAEEVIQKAWGRASPAVFKQDPCLAARLHARKGRLCCEQGNLEQALSFLMKAKALAVANGEIALSVRMLEIDYSIAVVQLRAGEYRVARAMFQEIIERNTVFRDPMHGRCFRAKTEIARIDLLEQRYDEAEHLLENEIAKSEGDLRYNKKWKKRVTEAFALLAEVRRARQEDGQRPAVVTTQGG